MIWRKSDWLIVLLPIPRRRDRPGTLGAVAAFPAPGQHGHGAVAPAPIPGVGGIRRGFPLAAWVAYERATRETTAAMTPSSIFLSSFIALSLHQRQARACQGVGYEVQHTRIGSPGLFSQSLRRCVVRAMCLARPLIPSGGLTTWSQWCSGPSFPNPAEQHWTSPTEKA